ncbi:MAG: 16S rRNA (uracil(1498)-N(3))-methyltransferase [Mycobacteriales bacterium]
MTTDPVFHLDPIPSQGEALLDGPEGHHAARVRRMRTGERLTLTDGQGRSAPATVLVVERAALRLRVESSQADPPPKLRFVAVQALAKGDRGERAVELLTELGVDEIVPWAAQHCVVKWDDKAAKARDRWASTAQEAAKQSRRTWWPRVAPLANTSEVAERIAEATTALVLHESAENRLAELIVPAAGEILVVVGPEGGITDDELGRLAASGAITVRLGDEVLRTSTAGAAALAAISTRTRWLR